MRRLTLAVPVPDVVYGALRSVKLKGRRGVGISASASTSAPMRDLSGDRAIEWTWVAAQVPNGPGTALDFGCGQSDLGLVAAHRGFSVTALDLEPVTWPFRDERMSFLQGDILDAPFGERLFDLVLNCSTVEHVGLVGRYGVAEGQPDGDLTAMAHLRAALKPGGRMLMTIPVGRDAVFAPLHRVYGTERLPRLLERFTVEHSEYWVKDADNRWVVTDEAAALAAPVLERLYGLGCFILVRP
jgi:SAM-dependent methyltransferase